MRRKSNNGIEIDDGTLVFGAGCQKQVERLLKKAAEQAARDAARKWKKAGRNPFSTRSPYSAGNFEQVFRKALDGALTCHSNNSGERPSIRMTAPDTGGRPFHFDHTSVSSVTIKLKRGETVPSPSTNGRLGFARDKRHTSRAGAHMSYLEREGAGETLETDLEAAAGIRAETKAQGRDRSPGGMQEYLEDPSKDEGLRKDDAEMAPAALVFSYGTIGDTLEERVAFWDLTEEHARGDRGTIQHRLIMELPHEATPGDRLAIMQAFTAKFEEDKVPFHVVLHAPTATNDSRNYHAHVVLLGRPSVKTPWPLGGKVVIGPEGPIKDTWDFAAKAFGPDDSKHVRWSYPKRQNVHPDYGRTFVKDQRKRFSDIVNARMHEVGNPVRYDHRSYRAMGYEVDAMKSISRIVKDKAKKGDRIVLDYNQTKRDIESEIQRIARERAPEYAEVSHVRAAVRKGDRELRKLEKEGAFLKGKPIVRRAAHVVRTFVKQKALDYARSRALHVERSIEAAQEVRALERVIEATKPEIVAELRGRLAASLRKARADGNRKEVARLKKESAIVPKTAHAVILNRVASDEVEALRAKHDRRGVLRLARVRGALREWRAAAAGARPQPPQPANAGPVKAAGLSVSAKAPPLDVKVPKQDQHPIWTSFDAVVEQSFQTGFQKYMAGVFKRYSQFILDNADPNVPGRTPLELAAKLVEAVKQHPAKAEELIMLHDVERHSQAAAPKPRIVYADISRPPSPPAVQEPEAFVLNGRIPRPLPEEVEPFPYVAIPLEPARTPALPVPSTPDALTQPTAAEHFPTLETGSQGSDGAQKPKRKKRDRRQERRRGILTSQGRARTREFER